MPPTTETSTRPVYVNFVTSGLGGIIGWTVVHPLNTLSIRMNLIIAQNAGLQPIQQQRLSFVRFSTDIIKNESVGALYRGLTAGWLRQVFFATSIYGFYEIFRDQLAKFSDDLGYAARAVAGVGSGAVAAFVSCPAEVPLVRMANDNALPLAQRRNYRGVGDAFLRIYREEGVRAFFRGVEPFILRAIMLGSIQVGTYDYFREVYRRQYQITDPVKNVFAAAMTSGLLYSFATMPLETVKNRMAVQKPDPKTGSLLYRSIPQTFHQIVKREGLTRLW
eukprot:CAMPEP_0173133862 /NCGR_PEP_ID=MMETSP1105-20130129/961_1 /TAXON_ID=2985 /ORGANISM="Ochromonas sp., Strain BG-1" /LENGTH=276 /DNA_ID=CAMNT_0014045575 /DNA_START=95 /DNA_END=922 /DNA_ORIENTATION=+